MPDTTTDQQDTSQQPSDLAQFFQGPGGQGFNPADITAATKPGVDPKDVLQAMFGETGDKVPLDRNDSTTALASGLQTVFNPHPVDAPNIKNFNFALSHKFEPEMVDGRVARNPDGSVIYKKELDAAGNPIIDPKSGQPVLEKSAYYVSPAKRLLQGFLSNALTLGAPAAQGHPDVAREVKKQQWETEQQQILQSAYKNAATNLGYARIQASNERQARSLEFKRDHDNMTADQFQTKYNMSRDRYDLAAEIAKNHEAAQTARLQGKTLDREQTLLTRAYGPAANQAMAEYIQNNPGKTMEDAAVDPHVLARASELYNQLKPHEEANLAIEKMIDKGELTPADMQNPAGVINAAQKSSLSKEEKKAILLDQMPGQQKYGQQEQLLKENIQGKKDVAGILLHNKLTNQVTYRDEEGKIHVFSAAPGDVLPANTQTISQAGSENTVPKAEQGQGFQAGIVSKAGSDLMEFIDQNRDKVGNWDAIRKELLKDGPIADPFIADLDSRIASYAALNPKMHGFRGQNAYLAFEKLVGRPFKNADSLIASIRGINNVADIIKEYTSPGTSPMLPTNRGKGGKGQPIRIEIQPDPKNPGKFINVPVYK